MCTRVRVLLTPPAKLSPQIDMHLETHKHIGIKCETRHDQLLYQLPPLSCPELPPLSCPEYLAVYMSLLMQYY